MKNIWNYCGVQQCREFLLSMNLLGATDKTETEQLRCIYAVSNHVECHYQKAYLKKRGGGKRTLLIPDPLLKMIQRNLLNHILYSIPISPSATAYFTGASIRDNGIVHVNKRQILKLDIKDFFQSITYIQVYTKAFSGKYFPPQAAAMLTALCCFDGYLPQGAPTSAAVSNLVMKDFDHHMEKWCRERKITYTRYCDDMTFSGEFDWKLVRNKVKAFLKELGFELNHQKTCLRKTGQRQMVTGIVVNDKVQAPRAYRRALRQELYYIKRFGVVSHIEKTQGCYAAPNSHTIYLQRLLGKINFVLQINPEDDFFRESRQWVRRQL